MKKYHIPILNDDYAVNVYIGDKESLIKEASKYLGINPTLIKDRFGEARGLTYDIQRDNPKHPLILIDGNYTWYEAIATLAHEAIHAIDYICIYIGIEDNEFEAHSVGAIMRHVLKRLKTPLGSVKELVEKELTTQTNNEL